MATATPRIDRHAEALAVVERLRRSSVALLLDAADATKREGMSFEQAMDAFAVALTAAWMDER
jgi:hypothetical protein